MLRSLWTRSRFDDASRASVDIPAHKSPEEVEHEARISRMKDALDELKTQRDAQSQIQNLSALHQVLAEDASTKDLFRELDGFLVLMNVLSSLHAEDSHTDPYDSTISVKVNVARLTFVVLSEGISSHLLNRDQFEKVVGYDALTQATIPLVAGSNDAPQILSFILSVTLGSFAFANFYVTLNTQTEGTIDYSLIDSKIHEAERRLSKIHNPGFLLVLYSLRQEMNPNPTLSYAIAKSLERIAHSNHRNQAYLNQLGLVQALFDELHPKDDSTKLAKRSELPLPEVQILQKLLRRLIEMGASLPLARQIFAAALRADHTIDSDVLEILRAGMRAKWPEFLSFHGQAGLIFNDSQGKAFPPSSGFTFMAWVYIERMPKSEETLIFGALSSPPSRWIIKLTLRSDGSLEFFSPSTREPVLLEESVLSRGRWTHIALVHQSNKGTVPTLRVFIDGHQTSTHTAPYPKPSPPPTTFHIGSSDSPRSGSKWSLSCAYLISQVIPQDLFRVIHHLGPRYTGNFQDSLIKFLTYEASTSLNIYLSSLSEQASQARTTPTNATALMKTLRDGLGIAEDQVMFTLSPMGVRVDPETSVLTVLNTAREPGTKEMAQISGDVTCQHLRCLDIALWSLGGPAIALRLVELATTPGDLTNALTVLTEGVRTSWQNSEDIERLRGYELLAQALRLKAHLMTLESFHILFDFLGVNFNNPENSVIVNATAYRHIALDMPLFSLFSADIQLAYFEHFSVLLRTSRFRRFNSKSRFSKFGAVRKFIFALQLDAFKDGVVTALVDALHVTAEMNWSTDAAIKPLVSYLAAALHEDDTRGASPRSAPSNSRVKDIYPHSKFELVFEAFIKILQSESLLAKFNSALPAPHICLLLLGPHPTSVLASQVLALLSSLLRSYSGFARKLDLASFWIVLKNVLPPVWDSRVHVATFDILLGRTANETPEVQQGRPHGVSCAHILPAILFSLDYGLKSIVADNDADHMRVISLDESVDMTLTDPSMEILLEELTDLQATSPSFRRSFGSKQATAIFLQTCRTFVVEVASQARTRTRCSQLLDKMCHLALMLTLDPAVDIEQKKELLEVLRISEMTAEDAQLTISKTPTGGSWGRSLSAFMGSSRLGQRAAEDKAVRKCQTQISTWRQNIFATEKRRFEKNIQDLHERLRQVQKLNEWRSQVTNDRSIWPSCSNLPSWRLDDAEGPFRIRNKFAPEFTNLGSVTAISVTSAREVSEQDDVLSVVKSIPPWDESFAFLAGDAEESEMQEDKHRRVRHELEPGDVIEHVRNVTRVVGVDSSPGLLIIGKTHIYMIEGLIETKDGEIIEARDAPVDILFVPGTLVELDGSQKAQRWSHDLIAGSNKRTSLFRDVALEMYFKDSRSLLLVFHSTTDRQYILTKLQAIQSKVSPDQSISPILRTPLLGIVGTKLASVIAGKEEILVAQKRWQAREMSNFAYLSIINQVSGRTPNDLTQYPVFPWIIKDYVSEDLDLNAAKTYRDLSTPMGALTDARREAAEARYSNLEQVQEVPFHYGTHFASSMITSHFLIRISPFSQHFKSLQGGDWDLPDRLFSNVARAWESASSEGRGDVRELIPEFFTCPEFLENLSGLNFGVAQGGERIDSVTLPPWAKADPLLFVTLHRMALESDYVSQHLPSWIDLIWGTRIQEDGCKQRDVSSYNVFHPLSYEGAVDLDTMDDSHQREASVGIIHNFGQTPRKTFSIPHPSRSLEGVTTLPVGTRYGIEEHSDLLIQSARAIRTIGAPVVFLGLDTNNEHVLAAPEGICYIPQFAHKHVAWGFLDHSFRVFVDRKLVQVVEGAMVKCCSFAEPELFATGSDDGNVSLWRLSHKDSTSIALLNIMRGHGNAVRCIAASRVWSIVVSGSDDSTAIIWDLNRAQYVRTIAHDSPVYLCTVNESTGYVATCSRDRLSLHTINARHIASFKLMVSQEIISSIAFHEREYSKLGVLVTGHVDGTIALRTWTAEGTPENQRAQWKITTLRNLVSKVTKSSGGPARITALKFAKESLYSGDSNGRVYWWTFPA